jgi:hypothetical protein
MQASTRDRVPRHTSPAINEQIRRQTEKRVRSYAARPADIPQRPQELDQEWDIERAIEANASALAFGGVLLAATADKRWLLLPAAVTAFLFQHAIQGWCPPVPILRRLGFRTIYEIEQERNALKALRGDFTRVDEASDKAGAALQAVQTTS